jgi:hypothetical protein
MADKLIKEERVNLLVLIASCELLFEIMHIKLDGVLYRRKLFSRFFLINNRKTIYLSFKGHFTCKSQNYFRN